MKIDLGKHNFGKVMDFAKFEIINLNEKIKKFVMLLFFWDLKPHMSSKHHVLRFQEEPSTPL